MRTINYHSTFDFGKGIDSIAETACGQAVEADVAQSIQGAGGQFTRFRLDIVESRTHLMKSLGVSASASLRYGIPAIAGAGGSAKMDFVEENHFNDYNLNILARVWVENPVLMLRNPRLKQEAAQLYSRSVHEFEKRYGDTFVSGLHTGGEFFGFISIKTRDTVTKNAIHGNLSASGAFGAWGAAFQTDLRSNKFVGVESKDIKVFIEMSGGGGRLESTVEGMLELAKEFPNKVKATGESKGWPFQVDLTEYRFLDLPPAANAIDLERQRELLTYLGEQRSDALSKLKNCQYILANLDEFVAITPEVIERLTAAQNKLNQTLDAIYRQASACFNDYHACFFAHSDFVPVYVDFPQRIDGVLAVPPQPPRPPFQPPGDQDINWVREAIVKPGPNLANLVNKQKVK